jgi:hypothetical protein
MSMMIDPLNELQTTPHPEVAEHVGHHGGRLRHPWLTVLVLVLVVAAIAALAIAAS